ncbi:hypothetical protein KGF54_002543 [Candida jiufengensis]|uniref:uncharacterized protein n=1 Tax=Candida jiufengensis TaxID=497108 RepID=UPI0022254232|nr:uncharacterized protein KGF54_002543 [Candida jiufengensis]KAI5953172.1 hypothetical protein KGF54_002543 [Candida jiufengensis]
MIKKNEYEDVNNLSPSLLNIIVVNASISEFLGLPYNPKIDFSSNRLGLNETDIEVIKNATDYLLNKNIEDIDEISHNILLLIYGGNYQNIKSSDIKLTLKEVYEGLGGEYEIKWKENCKLFKR